jgi:U6 snRNA-associated Sm-like protein LSm6
MSAKNPTDFLRSVIGRLVIVKLNSGVTYRGILACLDGYMNIAMEQTEEYINGQLKNTYADTFIRGNNGMSILVVLFYLRTHMQFFTFEPSSRLSS